MDVQLNRIFKMVAINQMRMMQKELGVRKIEKNQNFRIKYSRRSMRIYLRINVSYMSNII